MHADLQTRLTAEIQEHLRAGTTDLSDAEFYNPVTSYASTSRSEAERDLLFRRYPLVVGHQSQLSEVGAFLSCDVAGLPIVAVRDAEGEVSAFLNVWSSPWRESRRGRTRRSSPSHLPLPRLVLRARRWAGGHTRGVRLLWDGPGSTRVGGTPHRGPPRSRVGAPRRQ